MIVILAALIGAIRGVFVARARGGTRLDMAQYGAGYAIAFALIGVFVTIFLERMM
ncbi:hypothetical protein [Tropicimonas sp. IMCC34043]|uniref:hypothetical protein n=1 Tax=Tropicimonas sp. IMCC34043 TaxID=2248760 RepID=UPI0018E501A2|nr:hypothetical protein [Tropicimonas sp. IMCC34043]